MVPALVFFAVLAASALGQQITLTPFASSLMAKRFTPISAVPPFSGSVVGGLSATEADFGNEEVAQALRIHDAKRANSWYFNPAASASVADDFGWSLGVVDAIDAAAKFGSSAATPSSLARALAAAKSIKAGAPTRVLVPVSHDSPIANIRAVEADSDDLAAFGSPAPGSLARVLAAAKSIESASPPTAAGGFIPIAVDPTTGAAYLPVNAASPWARKWDADAAWPVASLKPTSAVVPEASIFSSRVSEDDVSTGAGYAPASWARALAAEKYRKAAGAIYTAPTTAYGVPVSKAWAAAKAADEAAALYGPLSAVRPRATYLREDNAVLDCSSAASPLMCALATGKAMKDAATGAVLTVAPSVPMSSWISSIPASAAANLARGSPAAYDVIPTADIWAPWSV